MVLKNKLLNKKAGKASVVKVKKSSKKKKPSPPVVHQPTEPSTAWKSLFPTCCTTEQMKYLLSGNWTFDINGALNELVNKQYPKEQFQFFVFLSNETNRSSEATANDLFPVMTVLIAPIDLKELPPFLRRKAYGENEAEILDLHSLKLVWKPTTAFCSSDVTVHALHCKRPFKTIEKLPEVPRRLYDYASLLDCRPSKAFPQQKTGKLLVEDAEFSVTGPDGTEAEGHYWKGLIELKDFIDGFIEDENLINDDEKTHDGVYESVFASVKSAIAAAFAKKRANAELQRGRVLSAVRDGDTDLLEQVKCAKIFPSNMTESEIGWKGPQTDHSYGPADHVF